MYRNQIWFQKQKLRLMFSCLLIWSSLLMFWNFIWSIKYTNQINQNIHYAYRNNIKVYNKEVRSIWVFKNWKHKVILRFMTALGFILLDYDKFRQLYIVWLVLALDIISSLFNPFKSYLNYAAFEPIYPLDDSWCFLLPKFNFYFLFYKGK